jgi:hypothetical protein
MDFGEVGWGDVDWIGLAQDRNRWRALVNLVLTLRVPRIAGKLSNGLTSGGLSSGARLHRERLSKVNSSNGPYEQQIKQFFFNLILYLTMKCLSSSDIQGLQS